MIKVPGTPAGIAAIRQLISEGISVNVTLLFAREAYTAAANAYIGPKVRRYIGEIDDHIRKDGFDGSFLIVQSTGGLYESAQAQTHCVRMLESGPAAGVIGTQALCRTLGIENAIAFDMGGTTAKAGVIHKGEALTTGAALIGGYDKALPIQIAMMDIFEVGTGGGSIAHLSEGGALRVGRGSSFSGFPERVGPETEMGLDRIGRGREPEFFQSASDARALELVCRRPPSE